VTEKSLDALRRDIDQIDDGVHDLLMKRAAIVAAVRDAKKETDGGFLRPGREAEVLRRLMARHGGDFPRASIVQIWREIFAAMTALQGPFAIAAWRPEGVPDYERLARGHFGAFTPVAGHARQRNVIAAVDDGSADAGLLPVPEEGEATPWWPHLLLPQSNALRIVARLPFVAARGSEDVTEALVVARAPFEDTGDDHSYLVFRSQDHIPRSRLKTALAAENLEQLFYAAWRDEEHPRAWLHLIELPGHFADGQPKIARIVEDFEPTIESVDVIGGFATPLALGLGKRTGGTER